METIAWAKCKFESIRDGESIASEPSRIGQVLTEYWQQVFNVKPTNDDLRGVWLDRFRKRINHTFTVDELRASFEDVDAVSLFYRIFRRQLLDLMVSRSQLSNVSRTSCLQFCTTLSAKLSKDRMGQMTYSIKLT